MPLPNRYFLLEAFEILGRHLFGDDWKGDEIYGQVMPDADETLAERKDKEAKVAVLDERISDLSDRISRTVKESEIAALNAEKAELMVQLGALNTALAFELADPEGHHKAAFEKDRRRRTTEETLIGALKSRAIVGMVGPNIEIEGSQWRDGSFRYSIPCSLIFGLRRLSAHRRDAAFVKRDGFDTWIKMVPKVAGNTGGQPDLKERVTNYLEDFVSSNPVKPAPKPKIRMDTIERFPGLTARKFDGIWDQVVPNSWKATGPVKPKKV